MKKSFRILLTLVLVFVMVLSLTACVSDCESGKHTLWTREGKAPTCTEEGVIDHQYCLICGLLFDMDGNQISKDDTIAPACHDLTEVPAKAPTCTNDGTVQYWECNACDKKFSDAQGTTEITVLVDSATGHVNTQDISAVAPTCTTTGVLAHKKCLDCGALILNNQVVTEADVVVPIDANAHAWDEGEITTNPTCSAKGVKTFTCQHNSEHTKTEEVAIDPTAHNLVHHDAQSATCTAIGWDAYDECTLCDYTTYEEISATGHTEGEVVIENVVEPDCKFAGSHDEVVYCTVCKAEISRTNKEDAALPHTEVIDEAVAATCTATGLTEGKHCSVCNEVLVKQEVVDALGHDKVSHDGQSATCLEKGWKAYETCSRCDYTTYEEIPATGHDYKAVVTDPNCTEEGYTTYTCVNCTSSYQGDKQPATGHSFGEWVTTTAPKCEEAGEQRRECEICHHSETKPVDATGHNLTQHDAKAPTCTSTGWDAYESCSECAYSTYEEIPALGHDIVYHDEQTPTCTEKGWYGYETCNRCDHTNYVEIPATGHTEETIPAVAPTCTETGLTAGTKCYVCGEVLVAQQTVDALGHDKVSHDGQDATCLEKGWKAYETCSRCDYTTYEEIPATGHSFGDWEVTTPATCTTVGEKVRECQRQGCNCSETEEIAVDQTAHQWGEWTQTKAPTCSTKGEEKRVCEHDATHVETRAIKVDEDAHKWGEWTQTTAPTCSATGVETRVCAHNNEHTETREVAIDEDAHAWGEWTQTTAPTCSTKGEDTRVCAHNNEHTETREVAIDEDAHNIAHGEAKQATCKKDETWWNAYEYCTLCDYTTKQEQAPVAHTVEVDQAVAPTCEETGLTEGSHCSVCSAVLAEQEVIDALGHNKKAVVTDPTCEEDGYTTYTCQRQGCDYSYVEVDEGSALGHDWQLKIDKQPTYTETGLSHEECSRCNAKQNENTVVEKLDHEHNYQQTVTAPTCTTDGYTTYKCTICNHTYTDNKVEKLNHNFGEWVVTTPATCENAGEKTRTCANDDSHKETESIPATGHAETSKYVVIDEKLYSVKTCECASTRSIVPAETVVEISNDADLQTVVEFGYSVKLTADIDLTSALEIVGKTLTINLNGHTLTADWASDDVVEVLFIRNDSHVVVTGNGTMISGDKSEHTNSVISCIENSTLTIENGTFISNDCGDVIYARTNSVVTILGGHFEAKTDYEGIWYVLDILESEPAETRAQFIVKGGEFVNFDPANHRCDGNSYTNKLADGFHSIYNEETSSYTVSAHTEGQWIDDVQAGCETTGSKHQVCADCGATIATATIDALGHNEVAHQAQAPTCEQPGWDAYVTCSRCDYTTKVEKDALGHNWDEGEITTAPTCMVEGVKTFTCQNDHNHTKTEDVAIDPTAHNFSNEYTIDVEPTCTEAGSKSKHCQNEGCQEKTAVTPIAAKKHAWGEVVYTWSDDHSECTATRVCANDAAHIESETAQVAKQITQHQACGLPELATLTAYFENTAFQTQTKFNYQTQPAREHSFGKLNDEVPATCTTQGTKQYKDCTLCEKHFDAEGNVIESIVIPVDANAHKPSETWTSEDGKHYHECENGCDEKLDLANCAGGTATCTDKAVCATCNNAYGNANGHSFGEWIAEVPTNCTTPGTKGHKDCSVCKKHFDANGIEIADLTIPVDENVHKPSQTWTSENGQHYHKCENGCNEKLDLANCDGGTATCTDKAVCATCNNAYGSIDEDAHKPSQTWTSENGQHYHKCENGCNEKLDLANCDGGTATCTDKAVCATCNNAYGSIDENAHSYGDWEQTTAPTCSATGVETRVCAHNSEHKETRDVAIDANAHAWDEGKITTNPTCSATGVKTYTCQHNSDHTKTEDVAIDENAHNWDAGVVTTPATCTTKGVKTYTCTHNGSHTRLEDVAIDENAHAPAETWTSENGQHYHKCENGCDAKLDLANCAGGTATCTEPATCQTCNQAYGNANGHDTENVEWSVDEENGTHYKVCNECGEKADEAKHSSTAKPENTHKDYHTFTCDACQTEYTETHNVFEEGCDKCDIPAPQEGWYLVTDASTLKAGDQIVIVAANANYAIGEQASNNRTAASITKSADKNTVTFTNAKVERITLKDGTTAGTFALNVSTGYLYAASTTSNHLKTQTTIKNNGSFTITINASGIATIKVLSQTDKNWLRYNPNGSNPIFSCYGSGQQDVSIYRKETKGFVCDHPVETRKTQETSATCLAEGATIVTCGYCDAEISRAPIKQLDHVFVNPQPTVGDSTTHTLTCQLCQTETKVEAHDWQDDLHECVCGTPEPTLQVTVVTKPVENQTALYSITTGDLYEGDEFTLTINVGALQTRQYVVVTLNDSQDALVLVNNTYTLTLAENVTFTIEVKEQTCEHPGLSEKPWTTLDEEDPAYATLHVRYCEEEGCDYFETQEHSLTHVDAQDATCEEDGWNAYDHCACGYTTKSTIPATGHNTTDVDWSSDGENHWKDCANCGADQDIAAHDSNKTAHNNTHHWTVCSICGATTGQEVAHTIVGGKCECGVLKATSDVELTSITEAIVLSGTTKNVYTADKYYILGEITKVDNATFGNIYIKDADGNTFYIYGLYSYEGTRYDSMTTKPAVGDIVVVYGVLGYYTDAQMKDAVLCEHNGVPQITAETIAESVDIANKEPTRDFNLPTVDYGTITWTSSNPTVVAVDNATGEATVTRQEEDTTVTLTAEITFAGATVTKTFNLTIAKSEGGEDTGPKGWVLVDDENTLQVGDQIVIVNSGITVAMGADRGNNRGVISIINNGDDTITLADGVQIIVLEAGLKAGQFGFKVAGGYLYAASNNGNQLKTKQSLDEHGSWKITIKDGIATIKAEDSTNRNWLRYNGTNSPAIFSCYSSGQGDVSIYKLICDHSETITKTVDATCTKDGSITTYCKDCNAVIGDPEVIPQTGHTEVDVPGMDSTCEDTGLTAGVKCSVCNAIITPQNTIAKKDHADANLDGKCDGCGNPMESTHTCENPCPECQLCLNKDCAECTEKCQGHKTEKTATLSFASTAQRTSFSNTQQVWEQNGITFTNNKASSTNAVANYSNPVRLYQNSEIIVKALGDITEITFDCNSGSYATALKNSIGTVSGATVSVSSDKVTVKFETPVDSNSFTIAKLTAQVRIDSITVTYLG